MIINTYTHYNLIKIIAIDLFQPSYLGDEDALPSLKQLRDGIKTEAEVQIVKAMGDIKNQMAVMEAAANYRKTWDEMLDLTHIQDEQKPLETKDKNYKPIKGGLWDPTSRLVKVFTYIYQ